MIALVLLPATALGPNALQAQDAGEPVEVFGFDPAGWLSAFSG